MAILTAITNENIQYQENLTCKNLQVKEKLTEEKDTLIQQAGLLVRIAVIMNLDLNH